MFFKPSRILLISVLLSFLISISGSPAFAMDPQPEPPDQITIIIDGQQLQAEVSPVIESGRTLVPLRAIFEALGAEVSWEPVKKAIIATRGATTLKLNIGSTQATKNGQLMTIQIAPKIIGGRTMVPLRFVGESFGADVQWDGVKRQVSIATSSGSSTSGGQSSNDAADQTTPPDQTAKPGTSIRIPRITLDPAKHLTIVSINNQDKKRPIIKLSNGKIYPLLTVAPDFSIPNARYSTRGVIPAAVQNNLKIVPPAATVDLRKYQTSIKDQAGRNTCVSFALNAAIEAAYKRMDSGKYSNLNLSEQYTHLVQKIFALEDKPKTSAELRENALGRWGYSGLYYAMCMYSRLLGIPEESYLPYVEGGSYEDTNEAGDNPRIDPASTTLKQKTIDDINLAATEFPQAALDHANYGITSWADIPKEKLKDLNYYRAVLDAGYELYFGTTIMAPDPTPNDDVWDPGTQDVGGHAMLIVGYDDDRQVFIVKNSWGFDNVMENGYTLMSYDWATKGYIKGAIYITGIITDPSQNTRPEQRFLGRWKLDHDGWKGTLDINHIPGFFRNDYYKDPALFGDKDNRIGTYYHTDGKAYRVNGSISGNRIEFYIDFNKPNLNYNELSGKRFIGYIFGWQPEMMAGSMASDGKPYGFYATKTDYLTSVAASSGDIKPADFAGVWEMDHDGWKGTLTISSVSSSKQITGSYKKQDGTVLPVTGFISDNQRITFDIPFNSGSPQSFSGLLYSWEKGVMSGSTPYQAGEYYGWVAKRISTQPLLIPDSLSRIQVQPNLSAIPNNTGSSTGTSITPITAPIIRLNP